MSHNIMHSTYPLNVNRGRVQNEWDVYVSRADYGEGASGLPNPIRWIENGVCENYEEAEKRIEELDDGWYDQIAVKYKQYKPCTSKKYESLEHRLKEAYKILEERRNKVHYANVSSEFIGCKHCGSRISTKYIRGNYCPICRADLRPASILRIVKKQEEKVEELRKQLSEEKRKGKYDIYWLVKIEYHT